MLLRSALLISYRAKATAKPLQSISVLQFDREGSTLPSSPDQHHHNKQPQHRDRPKQAAWRRRGPWKNWKTTKEAKFSPRTPTPPPSCPQTADSGRRGPGGGAFRRNGTENCPQCNTRTRVSGFRVGGGVIMTIDHQAQAGRHGTRHHRLTPKNETGNKTNAY